MYSDLFDALGGNPNASSSSNARSNSNSTDEAKPLLSFKAGKMELALQENGKFLATPDTRRCQVNLKYNDDSQLTWEWFDRREKKVMDTIRITDPVNLERADVPKSQDADCNDRVYYWKLDSEWRMIWLQDKEEDPELIDKINIILKQTTKPSTADSAEGVSDAAARGSDPVSARSPSSVSTTTRQVDALSNILENLGMPQGGDQNNTNAASAAAPAPGAAAAAGGTLTLADLQSAMGGVQTQHDNTNPPGLHEIVTPGAVSSLLANEEVRNRLMQELPEEQRSAEFLESCLRSPQVQQTLRSLTSALLPDDNGSMDGYHSVLANFQLDASNGQKALSEGKSPIQAFLDCLLASVEKENAEEGKEEIKGGEDGDADMEEN
jgi:26S proteasome regulatory subunit N13